MNGMFYSNAIFKKYFIPKSIHLSSGEKDGLCSLGKLSTSISLGQQPIHAKREGFDSAKKAKSSATSSGNLGVIILTSENRFLAI